MPVVATLTRGWTLFILSLPAIEYLAGPNDSPALARIANDGMIKLVTQTYELDSRLQPLIGGEILNPGQGDDYATLFTKDPEVAEKYGFETQAEMWGEDFDDAMNTLTIRLSLQEDVWIVCSEHTRSGVTRTGMVSQFATRPEAVLEFTRLVTQAFSTEGWHPVSPLWDEQLVNPEEMEQPHE